MIGNLRMVPEYDRPAEFWGGVWRRMESDAMAGAVFCDGSVGSSEQFAEMMFAGHVHPFCVYIGNDLAAVIWLTNLEGRMCRGHFCIFKEHWAISRYIGMFVVRSLLNQEYENGEYCFDVIVGMIPKNNIRAINVAKKSGFVYCGSIPFGAWIEKEKRSVDMIVLVATREV